jgi:hypothetical protein
MRYKFPIVWKVESFCEKMSAPNENVQKNIFLCRKFLFL